MVECICGCGIVISDECTFIPDDFHLMKIIGNLSNGKLIISSDGEVKLE